MERTVYLVKLRDGNYVSTKRFNHRDNTHVLAVSFAKARVFTRESDAVLAASYECDAKVVEAALTI